MTEKEFKKITELLDDKITLYQAIGEPFGKDLDIAIKLSVAYEKLQQENKLLKENAENNDKVVDKVNWENQLLKKEIHQLKEQLEAINLIKYLPNIAKLISSGEIPKEVYNKYLGNVPCGFMNEKDLIKWLLEKSDK